jgi:hypothetical protein
MLKLRILFVLFLLFVVAITTSQQTNAVENDGFIGEIEVSPSTAILLPTESKTFTLTGNYSQKPIENNEIKPGNAEWNLITFGSNKTGVTLTRTYDVTSVNNVFSIKAQTTASTKPDDYELTFTMQVKFPKLKKTDGSHLIINGNKQYFGPYSCSTKADLKVIDIIIKRKVAGQGDFITISGVQDVSSVIVGQKVELKVEVKPDNTNFSNTWSITNGNPIKDYQPTNEKAEVKNLTNADYSQKNITYYYTAGGNTAVKATITVGRDKKEKNASFSVLIPKLVEVTYKGEKNIYFRHFVLARYIFITIKYLLHHQTMLLS